jgi:hypothetical protein
MRTDDVESITGNIPARNHRYVRDGHVPVSDTAGYGIR